MEAQRKRIKEWCHSYLYLCAGEEEEAGDFHSPWTQLTIGGKDWSTQL